jgi:hypothetical protein
MSPSAVAQRRQLPMVEVGKAYTFAPSTRVRDGKRLIAAGPFVVATEQLGGDYLIDVPNLDEAVAFAGRLPPASTRSL